MTSLHHVLAATDFSASSLHAVDRGFLLASSTGARYTIVHALGLNALAQLREFLGADAPDLSRGIAAESRETLQQIATDPSRNRGVSAALQLDSGLADAVVLRQAQANAADLIVLGAHGKGFVQRFLLGSTASRLVRKSPCPVLVVKEPCRAPYRRVLVAVDFSLASEHAIRIARQAAPNADIVLLHVFEVPFEGKLQYAGVDEDVIRRYRIAARERSLSSLHAIARAAGLSATGYTARVVRGDVTRQILSAEVHCDCDLVVVGKHGLNVTEELLLGSLTIHILAESRSDVLVVVDKQAATDAAPASVSATGG